ncbi:MAG: SDR family NAD(P)-dependent oxidoreductase, partial [Lachnospiraceae bacterium]|nr:SDR family NAD(P)-dependent oxidoreductase [Lachnospiraceae bacterium]
MRTVIITGSSRGIGLACAHRFASEGGWNIILNSRSEKDLEKAASEISSYEQTSVLPVCGDVSDKDFIKTLFQSCRSNFGSLDVLINNAGIDRFNLLQDT